MVNRPRASHNASAIIILLIMIMIIIIIMMIIIIIIFKKKYFLLGRITLGLNHPQKELSKSGNFG